MFTIFFALYENKIMDEPNTYKATIQYVGTVDLDNVLNRMKNEGLLVPKANALPILNSFFKAVGGYLLEGFKVKTPFINFGVSIKGQFKGSKDSFDSKRHTLAMLTAPNKDYSTEVTKQAHIERKESKLPHPNLSTYIDRVSQASK